MTLPKATVKVAAAARGAARGLEEKYIELKSPVGAASMKYSWPLKKGKGDMKRSEVRE
jgi:hypothetical protein